MKQRPKCLCCFNVFPVKTGSSRETCHGANCLLTAGPELNNKPPENTTGNKVLTCFYVRSFSQQTGMLTAARLAKPTTAMTAAAVSGYISNKADIHHETTSVLNWPGPGSLQLL